MKYAFPMVCCVAIERLKEKVLKPFVSLRTWWLCWLWGVKHGKNVVFRGRIYIRTRRRGEISLGNNVYLTSKFTDNLVGLTNPVVLDTRQGGRIVIGDNTGLSAAIISSRTEVRIGANVKIGGNVRIFDHDFHSLDYRDRRSPEKRENVRSRSIVIEDDCFIGANAVILKGTRLGRATIVGAGSVVGGRETAEQSIVVGNPAKIKGEYR